MILSDGDILDRLEAGDLVIEPLEDLELQVQPASVDVRLGREFLEFQRTNIPSIHPNSENQVGDYVSETVVEGDDEFILHPGDFVLGTTRERVEIPGDLVAQVEGRSSLGRLAIVVHASLPADETLFLWTPEEGFGFYDIGEIVEMERAARAVSFDPVTLSVRTFEITDFITNPKRRIFRLELDSGRSVHVTEDHNVFTLDEHGAVSRIRTGDAEDEFVMVPGQLPEPRGTERHLDLTTLLSDAADDIVVYATDGLGAADWSDTHARTRNHYQEKNAAPLDRVAYSAIPEGARVGFVGSDQSLPRKLPVTEAFGWVLGYYIAEGDARRKQLVFTDDEDELLERVAAYFDRFDTCLSWQRGEDGPSQLTVCSELWAAVFTQMAGAGRDKTIPERAWNWESSVLEELYDGLLDGDGGHGDGRRRDGIDTLYTDTENLADRAQYLGSRLGLVTAVDSRDRSGDGGLTRTEWGVEFHESAHRRGTFVPNPSGLLTEYRERAGLTVAAAASEMGYASKSSVSDVENRDSETVRRETLRRFRDCYRAHGVGTERVDAILSGSVRFDRVERVVDTGRVETTYDLEVRPDGRPIENFLGGFGGIFLSNTAGFIDPGFRGRITLELSNLGTAPVALSPGMRISQLVFTELKTPARKPYGTERGSKYQDQSGPAASRIQNDEEFGGEQG